MISRLVTFASRLLVAPVYNWLDRRIGLSPILERVLKDPVPERGGWFYTLGAVIFLLIIVQVVTGIFLMLYYDPSWTGARDSIIYIQEKVFLGWLVRGIHYWTMVVLVVLVGIHMLRVFISSAFKSPREFTWILGVLLLILMVATAFTGGILRWDRTGYFDAEVGTTIAGWTPFIGQWLITLWRGTDMVGPLTLARTFPLHVWILPAGLLLIAPIHILLIILQGQFGAWVNYEPEPANSPSLTPDQMASKKKLEEQVLSRRSMKVNIPTRTTWFWPQHVFKEAVVTLAFFGVIFAASMLIAIPIEGPPDPATIDFAPASMWFFLFLDQMLLLFPGGFLIPVGAVIAPTVVILILLFMPWLDRRPVFHPLRRLASVGFMSITVAAVLFFALLAASRVFNYGFVNFR